MARKVKFPLELKDGYQARSNIEEVRAHFDLAKIVAYFHNGRLKIWLEDHYLPDEAAQVAALDGSAPDLAERLCTILGVEGVATDHIDTEIIQKRETKRQRLSQYTTDLGLCNCAEYAAFDQSDLDALIDEGAHEIILCNNTFRIPLLAENRKYYGVGKAVAVIESDTPIEFAARGIQFVNVAFDEKYVGLQKRRQVSADFLAELCGVLMNGKLKKGTLLWINQVATSIYWDNSGYTYRVNNNFMLENSSLDSEIARRKEVAIGYGKPRSSRNVLLLTNKSLYLSVSEKIRSFSYKNIDTIDSVNRDAESLYIRMTKGANQNLVIPSPWKSYIPMDKFRLFLLVAARLLGKSTYEFTKSERDILSEVKLEALDHKSVTELL